MLIFNFFLFKIPVSIPSQLRKIKLLIIGKKPSAIEIKNHPKTDFKPSMKSLSKHPTISCNGELTIQRMMKKKIFCIKNPFRNNVFFCFDNMILSLELDFICL